MMKVLVVDDKEDARYLLSALLTGHGHQVLIATNGEEAVEKARADPPDLIVSDILMPVMDGFRLCREIRKDEGLRDTLFVFYTATYTQDSDADFALKLGADDFIRKPAEPDAFLARIEAIVEKAAQGAAAREAAPIQEAEVLRLYSDRLVEKLEKRSLELQKELALRQQAEESLRRHAKRLEILRDIDVAILEARSPKSVAEIAAKALHSILLTARVSVATFDVPANQATVLAVDGAEKDVMKVGDVLPIELLGVVEELGRGEIRRIDDVGAVRERSRKQEQLLAAGIHSYIVVPLRARRELIGSLNVGFSAAHAATDDAVQAAVEIANQLAVALRQAQLREDVERQAAKLAQDVKEISEARASVEESYRKLARTLDQTIQALAAAIEVRDSYTAGHQRRVTELAVALGQRLGLSGDALQGLRVASMVHDIGKLAVPAELLSKPSTLTATEFRLIQSHPDVAREILSSVEFPWPVATIISQHHERADGSGYPLGIGGDEILFEARILGIADVVEAMVSHRPYRPARGVEAALDEIRDGRGTRYDEDVADACVALFESDGFRFDTSA
ncbi:MAG: HD domain-containing phosphohydrolase [Candidatus Bipolaricaulia bacterium]